MAQLELDSLYKIRFNGDKALLSKNKIWSVLCTDFFQKFITPHDTILDVAAGYGEFINNIQGAKKLAIDLNPETKKFLNSDVLFFNQNILDDSFLELKEKVDVCFMSNFLEHLESKEQVVNVFKNCFKILNTGGRVMVLQPNIKLVGGAYWDFIDHKVELTESSLQEAGELAGFKTKYLLKRFLPYTTKSALPQHPLLVKMYLKSLPLSGYFFGKQSYVVFEKR